jgi:hypothetical protein
VQADLGPPVFQSFEFESADGYSLAVYWLDVLGSGDTDLSFLLEVGLPEGSMLNAPQSLDYRSGSDVAGSGDDAYVVHYRLLLSEFAAAYTNSPGDKARASKENYIPW